jgi:hypothetical protein
MMRLAPPLRAVGNNGQSTSGGTATMTDPFPNPEADRADRGDPIDRRTSDGTAGAGDMLGGLSTGAGGRLGPDQGVERGGVTVPMSGDGPGFEGQTVPMGEVPVEVDEENDGYAR